MHQKHGLLTSKRRHPTSTRPRLRRAARSLRTSPNQGTPPTSAGLTKSATVREGSMGAYIRVKAVLSERVRDV